MSNLIEKSALPAFTCASSISSLCRSSLKGSTSSPFPYIALTSDANSVLIHSSFIALCVPSDCSIIIKILYNLLV